MNQRVELIEKCHDRKVAVQKELLEADFCDWKEDPEEGVMLNVQNSNAMLLRQFCDFVVLVSAVQCCTNLLGHGVC